MKFALLTALVATSTLGCAFDHSRRVARATLFTSEGVAVKPVLEAALHAKFPPGSSLADLHAYARAAGGECRERWKDATWCEIPIMGQFCGVHLLGIKAFTEGAAISRVEVTIGGLGC